MAVGAMAADPEAGMLSTGEGDDGQGTALEYAGIAAHNRNRAAAGLAAVCP